MTPGLMAPPYTRCAPNQTTRVSPMFRHICMNGPGTAITVLARMSARVMESLAARKRRFSYSVLESAFTTRMPVMSSRIVRTTPSSRSCTRR